MEEISPRILSDDDLMAMFIKTEPVDIEANFREQQGVFSTSSTPQREGEVTVEEDLNSPALIDAQMNESDGQYAGGIIDQNNAAMSIVDMAITELQPQQHAPQRTYLDYFNDLASPTTSLNNLSAAVAMAAPTTRAQQNNFYFDAMFAEQQRQLASSASIANAIIKREPNTTTTTSINTTTNGNAAVVAGYTIRHIQGFTEPVEEEQPGGSGNKHPLPLQVIEMALNNNEADGGSYNASVLAHEMIVNVFMIGYEHYSNSSGNSSSNGNSYVAQKKVLDDKPCAQSQFVEVSPGIYRASFSNIICTHTSHHCGKSLCLRFTLVKDGVVQASLDSSDFKTLTQRAWQKRKEKSKLRMTLQQQQATAAAQSTPSTPLVIGNIGMLNSSSIEKAAAALHSSAQAMNSPSSNASPSSNGAKVINIVPCIGPCTGGQLVKITGLGFNTTASRISVKFGDKSSRHVYSVSKNTIICETPDHNSGTVDIKIALDGRSKHIESKVNYTFIRPSDSNGVTKFLQQVLGADHRFLHKM